MKKMSKYLLSALSVLGSMNLCAIPSQAIGTMPPYGIYDVISREESEKREELETSEESETNEELEAKEFQGDGYIDSTATNEEEDYETEGAGKAENVPAEVDNTVGEQNKTADQNDFVPEEKPNIEKIQQAPTQKDLIPENGENTLVGKNDVVQVVEDKQVEEKNINVQKKLRNTPVKTEIQPEMKQEKLLNEPKKADLSESQPQLKPDEVKDLQKTVNVDEMKNLMSKKVVTSVRDLIPEFVAYLKMKEAYSYLEKEYAFDLPHKAYRDLTLLPQYDEVKMFTHLLCNVFDVDAPSEEQMIANYKAKLPNLVVANKYLNNILDDLYDLKQAQKNGTYELNLSDLNFVNRLLISAASNDSDDSSTLPNDKKNNRTVFSVNDNEKKVAKKLFGKKIGTTVSDDANKDNCAKTVLRKITNNEIKEEVFA